MPSYFTLLFLGLLHQAIPWHFPEIPSGRRTQYYVIQSDNGYKYGYDTGDGIAAKQEGDANNEVIGFYTYGIPYGRKLKYTAGVRGFVPEGTGGASLPSYDEPLSSTGYQNHRNIDYQTGTGDASYRFSIDTPEYKRIESSDPRGNIEGSYSYVNKDGTHDLSYIAGENSGFVATSGSLSQPNGLLSQIKAISRVNLGYAPNTGYSAPATIQNHLNPDGSYSLSYSTSDSSRQESADSNNNVQGRYSYTNEAGSHDLNYEAGALTGFKPTGGSLSQPNGLGVGVSGSVRGNWLPTTFSESPQNQRYADGSYSFSYSTGDSFRQESTDSNNNVQGRYSYTNGAGIHDLNYMAGAETGSTDASLSQPNGLDRTAGSPRVSWTPSIPLEPAWSQSQINPDGSYSFSYSTSDSSRQESADLNNNVQGKYSYTNEAGSHDLSYVAGAEIGFKPTGGSLSQSNGHGLGSVRTTAPIPISIGTDNSNDDDGSYTTTEETTTDDQANTGDASYNFTINTADYQRQESSDSAGNVRGSYSYQNSAGSHDLNFIAGSATGFQPTGGSLQTPPGLNQGQLQSGSLIKGYLPPPLESSSPITPNGISPYATGKDGAVKFFLPPSPNKVGYVF